MISRLKSSLSLHREYKHQLLFLLSMMLYHSTEYFSTSNEASQYGPPILTLLSHSSLTVLHIMLISLSALNVLLIVVRTCIQRQQNYLVQITEKLLYPIHMYTVILSVSMNQLSELSTKQILTTQKLLVLSIFFLIINTAILVIKSAKINLRYEDVQKSCTRIVREEYFLLLSKVIINAVMAIWFADSKLVYILLLALINLVINASFFDRVIYQHPNVEFLYLITQFYQWIPVAIKTLEYICNTSTTNLTIFGILALVLYFSVSLSKPKTLVRLLQKKYQKCLQDIQKGHLFRRSNKKAVPNENNNQSSHLNFKKSQKLIDDLIAVIGVYNEMYFGGSSLKQFSPQSRQHARFPKALEWSDNFKSSLISFLVSKTLPYSSPQSFSSPTTMIINPTKTQLSFDSSSAHNFLIENTDQISNSNSHHKKQQISESLWALVEPYIIGKSERDLEIKFRRLKYFVCYNMPCVGTKYNKMVWRLFYTYFSCRKGGWREDSRVFQQIQAQICHNHLLQKIGNHLSSFQPRPFNHLPQSPRQQQDNQQKCSQSPKNKSHLNKNQNFHNQNQCLRPIPTLYNPHFNDVLLQQRINTGILRHFKKFIDNERFYLKIFKNIKENKENVMVYYQKRNQVRKQIEEMVEDYGWLKRKNEQFFIIAKFIVGCYLNKQPYESKYDLEKSCESLLVERKMRDIQKKQHLKPSSTIQFNKINGKIIKLHKTQFLLQNDPQSHVSSQEGPFQCVTSALNHQGRIFTASSTFKQLMQIQNQQQPSSSTKQSETSKQSNQQGSPESITLASHINDFVPQIWRNNHFQIMFPDDPSSAYSSQTLNHTDDNKKFLMISKKSNVLLQVKFRMYWFLRDQEDLLLVMDFEKYEKIDYLVVKETNTKKVAEGKEQKKKKDRVVFVHGLKGSKSTEIFLREKNQIYQSNETHSQKQQPSEEQVNNHNQPTIVLHQNSHQASSLRHGKVTLFNKEYTFITKEPPLYRFQETLKPEATNERTCQILLSSQKSETQNKAAEKMRLKEENFIKYRSSFKIYSGIWTITRVFVVLTILIYWITFQIWITKESEDREYLMTTIRGKMFLLLDFVIFDAYTVVDIGVMYNLVKGQIYFSEQNKEKKDKFLIDVLISAATLKEEIHIKYFPDSFTHKRSPFTQILFQTTQLGQFLDKNVPYTTHSLLKQVQYYQTLSIFTDILFLDEFRGFYKAQNQTKFIETIKQKGSITLPTEITKEQQRIMSQLLRYTVLTKEYEFNKGGFLDLMLMKEEEVFKNISALRTFFFIIIEVGFFAVTIALIYLIYVMKKSLLENYNHAARVSERFLNNFQAETKVLQNFVDQINNYKQQKTFSDIKTLKQHSMHEFERIEHVTQDIIKDKTKLSSFYETSPTGRNATKSKSKNKSNRKNCIHPTDIFSQSDSQLNLRKFLLQSAILPFLRFGIVAVTVIIVYRMSQTQNVILQKFSQAMTANTKLSAGIIHGFGMNLFEKKSQYDELSSKKFQSQFNKTMKQIQETDKFTIVKDLFPFNEDIAHNILYYPAKEATEPLNIQTHYVGQFQSFLEETTRLTLSFKTLFAHLISPQLHLKEIQARWQQVYYKVNEFIYLSDGITEAALELLEKNIDSDYSAYLVGILMFLVFDLLMGLRHFESMLSPFYEEYLRLASFPQLEKQKGFEVFVHLAMQNGKS